MSRAAHVAALIAVAATAGGCHRGPARCAPGQRSSFELRDASGALQLAQKGDQLCDEALRVVGSLTRAADGTVTLHDAAGAPQLTLARESDQVAQARGPAGPRYRLYRDDKQLRVLQPDGTPLGTITPGTLGAVFYSPAQAPLGRIQQRDRDAVVTDLSGSVQAYLNPTRDPVAAGVFGLSKLNHQEQLAIYLYWSP